MPLTHIRAFRVRYYECGADGQLYHANYLRYMQEAAFDASAAAGYDVARYEAIDRIWLVRETDLEVLRPLRYPDTVEVKTWVADFRHVRSWRAYEFRLAGSGCLVARAQTDWAFLDRTTGKPAAIPSEMMASFFPEGVPPSMPPRARFPAVPQPPDGAFAVRRRVKWDDLDAAEHVNNAVYLAYLEDCQIRASAALGTKSAKVRADGLTTRVRRQQIQYLQPATVGDELEIAIWASGVQGAAGLWYSVICRVDDGSTLVRARAEWACVETGPGTSSTACDPVGHGEATQHR